MTQVSDDKKLNIEEELALGHTVQFHPIGSSMWPLFVRDDDMAIVEPAYVYCENHPAGICRGDVVVYRRPGGHLVIHRVMRTTATGIYMLGDHQTEPEGELPYSCIRGVMTGFIRKGRSLACSNVIYRILSGLWLWLRPLRWGIIHTGSIIKKAVN